MSVGRLGLVVGVLAALGALGWWTLDRMVIGDLAELRESIAQAERRIEFREEQASTLKRDEAAIREIASRTIAGKAEEGVHRLRLALTAVADAAGLRDVSVTSRHVGASTNPGSRELSVLKGMGERADFDVIGGSLEGRGGIEEVVRALALLDAQGWPRQVARVMLTPEEGGKVIRVGVDVQTMVLRDLPPEGFAPEPAPLDEGRAALVARLASRNVFAPPPAPVAEAPVKPAPVPAPEHVRAAPPPPPPPPYGEWSVSAVIEVGSGAELWLTHANSGQTVILTKEQSHLGAVFAGLSDGMAIISIGGDRYALAPGETLANRDRPAPVQ